MPYNSASPEEADTNPRLGAENRPPGQLLTQAAQLASAAEALLEKAVIAERAKGTSWEVIGDILGGVSKSAAQKRWGSTVAKWRESNVVQPTAPVSPRDELVEFTMAYDELEDAWHGANEIVQRQPLLADLNNATAALSGSPGDRAARLSHWVQPPSHTCESTSDWLVTLYRTSQGRERDIDRTAFLDQCRNRDPRVRELTLKLLADWLRHQDSTQRHSGGGVDRQLLDEARDLRAERHPTKLTLEERVANLERAFGHLLSEQAEGP
ncbi:hypothetical protein OG226_12245 [Streptomyces sp. NBC_01261]|uniref:hypothetical protein n=1 Tax=Streptomyces sp. NBC_01261 TaxID=2903802 RepID=UPI002E31E1C6|nr:hypothetical protein [Streptomyces sp. NBC_01261]